MPCNYMIMYAIITYNIHIYFFLPDFCDFFLFLLVCFETGSYQPKLNGNSIYIYHVCTLYI